MEEQGARGYEMTVRASRATPGQNKQENEQTIKKKLKREEKAGKETLQPAIKSEIPKKFPQKKVILLPTKIVRFSWSSTPPPIAMSTLVKPVRLL